MDSQRDDQSTPRLLAVAGLACLTLSYVVPAHYAPWASFQSEWMACLGIGLLLLQGRSNTLHLPSALVVITCAVGLVPLVQLGFGLVTFRSDALIPALYAFGAGLAVHASSARSADNRTLWIDRLFWSLIAAAVLSAGMALIQWLQVGYHTLWLAAVPPGGRPFANLAQPNHLATLLVLGLAGVVRAHERRMLGTATLVVAGSWLCVGLVATQSRSGLLGLSVLALWWLFARRRFGARLSPVVVCLSLVAVFALAAMWEPLTKKLFLDSAQPLGERLAVGPRTGIWAQAFEASLRQPWAGYGWNQAASAQLAVAAEHAPLGRPWDSAHNIVLDLALAMGWPLALLCTGAFAVWFLNRVRSARDVDDWALLAALSALLVHALLEYPLAYAYFLAPLALMMGAVERAGPPVHRVAIRWISGLLGVGMLVMLFWIGSEYFRVEQAHREIRMLLMNFASTEPVQAEPADVVLLDAPVALQRLMLTNAAPGMSAPELETMRATVERYPMPPALMRLAVAQGLNGQPANAEWTLRTLCAMHPPDRCREGVESWILAAQRWPVLSGIQAPMPPTIASGRRSAP